MVRARLAGMFDNEMVTAEGDVELKTGATIKAFFDRADTSLGYGRQRYFKRSLKMTGWLTILLNGDRLDLPEGLKKTLVDGDEVTVLTPMAGG